MKKLSGLLLLTLLLSSVPFCFAIDPERLNIYYNNGITYLKDNKYSSAILEFKKVLRQRPYDLSVRKSLATAYIARSNYYKNSEKSYKKAINDLRSAVTYLKYWEETTDDSQKAIVQNAINDVEYLKRMYAPLKSEEATLQEAKNLRAGGEFAASLYEYNRLLSSKKYRETALTTASDIYKSLNNEKRALDFIRIATSENNGNGMLHFKYAVILEDIGNDDAAMDEYSRALKYANNNNALLDSLQNLWMARSVQNPKDSQALINLGAVLQKRNNLELAKAQYLKARQINPNDPVSLINLASVYTELKDYDNAIKVYDEMLLRNQGDLSARFYKAKLLEQKGQIQDAVKLYNEILTLKKDDENARNALNDLLSGLTGEKLESYLYQEAMNRPNDYDAQFKYAFEAHKNKKYLAAIEFYKKAIAINPKNPEPFINIAQIYMEQNENSKAQNAVLHGLSFLPDNLELKKMNDTLSKAGANELYQKGAELYNAKDYQGALSYYTKIPYQTPEILTVIGNCYMELGQNNLAKEYYSKVLQTNPNDQNALLMLANIAIDSKNNAEAKMYLNKVISIDPNNIDAKNILNALNEGEEGSLLDSAISMYENKNYQGSLSELEKLTLKNPKNAYAQYYKGLVLEELNQAEKALDAYKKSVAADPKFALGYYMAAVVLDTKEDYKSAVSYYEKFIQLKAAEGVEDEYSAYAKTRTAELKNYLSQLK